MVVLLEGGGVRIVEDCLLFFLFEGLLRLLWSLLIFQRKHLEKVGTVTRTQGGGVCSNVDKIFSLLYILQALTK